MSRLHANARLPSRLPLVKVPAIWPRRTMTQEEVQEPSVTYPRMGSRTLTYVGLPRDGWRDAYHVLLTMPLAAFFAVMAAAFLAVNGVFAALYLLDPGGVSTARPGNFQDAFFFSVQTLGTLGY